MTARDKKVLLAIVPIVVIAGYWFAVLGPKRSELRSASADLVKAQKQRDEAVAGVKQLEAAKAGFDGDYRTVLRLARAIPSTLDMPGLLVDLDKAARGTGIRFEKVSTAESSGGTQTSGSSQPPSAPAGNAAAGGAPAQTGPGRATETAGNTTKEANAKSSAPKGATGSKGAAPPSGGSGGGSGGSSTSTGAATSASQAPGLESVPLTFTFSGSFFRLADFFQELKRFVGVADDRLVVRGRLLTIESFSFTTASFPALKAEVNATVYLVPKQQGTTAGATTTGPEATAQGPAASGTPAQASVPPAGSAR